MKYRLLAYNIRRLDGGISTGLVPYRHNDVSPESISQFVARYLDHSDEAPQGLGVDIIKTYDSEHEWIIDVHQLRSFGILQREMNLAGDLLAKYDLPAGEE